MQRRRFLALSGSTFAIGVAGCTSSGESEFDGDARVTLAGMTATGVSVESRGREIEETVASELDVRPVDVRAHPGAGAVEVRTDVADGEFVDALDAAGLDVDDDQLEDRLTEETRDLAVTVVEDRLEMAGVEDASVEIIDDGSAIGITLPDGADVALDDLLERGDARLVAGYPDDAGDGSGMTTEPILSTGDFREIQSPQTGSAGNPRVPVTLTDEAAQRFAETMREAGFTGEGTNSCAFDPDEHDAPDEPSADQYCLFTVVDGEYVYGAGMAPSLAAIIEDGEFKQEPRFVVTAATMDEAEELHRYLKTGAIPADVEIQES